MVSDPVVVDGERGGTNYEKKKKIADTDIRNNGEKD